MPTSTPSSFLETETNMFDGIGQLLFVLGLMLLIIFVAYYFTRYIGRRFGTQGGPQGIMTVVDRLPVSQNKVIMLVRVGERCFLIGATQQQITSLGEMMTDELPDIPPPTQYAPDRVASYISNLIKNRGSKQKQEYNYSSFSDTFRQQTEEYNPDDNDDKDGDRP